MTPAEIRKLLALAEQGKSRDLALYAQQMQAAEAVAARKQALLQGLRETPALQDYAASARWQRWSEQEMRRLQTESRRIEVEKEARRKTAATAVARVQALELLLEKARKADIQQARRRAEQNGAPPDA